MARRFLSTAITLLMLSGCSLTFHNPVPRGSNTSNGGGGPTYNVPLSNSNSLFFNGSQYLDCGVVHQFDRTDPFTFSLWIRMVSNSSGYKTPFANWPNTGGTPGYTLSTGGSDNRIGIYLMGNEGVGDMIFKETTATTYVIGAWAHYAVTYDGSSTGAGYNVYVNGVLVSDWNVINDSLTVSTVAAGQNLFLGASRPGSPQEHLDGHMDEISVWNSSLNASQVGQLYNAGVPTVLTTHPSAASLASWWRMGDGDTLPTIQDQVGTADCTAQNMTGAHLTTNVP